VAPATEVEVKQRKYLVDDGMHDPRCYRGRCGPGRRSRAALPIKALDTLTPANPDQKVDIEIVRKALQWPAADR